MQAIGFQQPDGIDPFIQAKTRQRIGISLGHCAIRKVIVRVQSSPSLYQLSA